MNEMIKPPSTAIHPKVLGSHRWNPFLKVIVKHMFLHLVDVHIHIYCYLTSMVFRTGTHVLARVPRHMQAAFRGRIHNPT